MNSLKKRKYKKSKKILSRRKRGGSYTKYTNHNMEREEIAAKQEAAERARQEWMTYVNKTTNNPPMSQTEYEAKELKKAKNTEKKHTQEKKASMKKQKKESKWWRRALRRLKPKRTHTTHQFNSI
jgi:hypothetical protein